MSSAVGHQKKFGQRLRGRMSDLARRLHLPHVDIEVPTAEKTPPNPVVTYYLIVVSALVLTSFGIIMGFSASAVVNIADGVSPYTAFIRQLVIIVAAVIIAAALHMAPRSWWYRSAIVIFVGALVLQTLVLTPLGVEVNGNRNWVEIPPLPRFQPSEFLKLALILLLARVLDRPGARLKDWRQIAVTVGLPLGLAVGDVMLGHDMGTALVVIACALGALWVAGLPGKWFGALFMLGIPAAAFFVAQNPSRLRRFQEIGQSTSLSDPRQIDHALWAFGSGGLLGLGPGASREKWMYLQEGHTDFVLAILGEEFGLIGSLTVLLALGTLVWAMVRVCIHTDSLFVAISAGGVASWIGAQGIINVLSVTGMGPVVGVPLPLVSYGGSSFVFTAMAIGIVAGFARVEAGMSMFTKPDEASAGRDPRLAPRRRPADGSAGAVRLARRTSVARSVKEEKR